MVAHKNAHIIIITAIIVAKHKKLIVKLGGAVGRFGDYLCVDCANYPCESGHNQYHQHQFTRLINKSTHHRGLWQISVRYKKDKAMFPYIFLGKTMFNETPIQVF